MQNLTAAKVELIKKILTLTKDEKEQVKKKAAAILQRDSQTAKGVKK